jgi:hypothetical protein
VQEGGNPEKDSQDCCAAMPRDQRSWKHLLLESLQNICVSKIYPLSHAPNTSFFLKKERKGSVSPSILYEQTATC